MLKSIRSLAISAFAMCVMSANAMGVGPATTYSNLTWSFSSNVVALPGCSQLRVDGTGDLSRGSALTMAGSLGCSGGAFGVSGVGYFSANGQLNMTLQVGVGVVLTCFVPGATFSGTCTVWSSGNAGTLGTANIFFVP